MPTGPGDVLDLIRHGHASTRGDVLEVTGLSRMTVAQRLDALLAAGMIVEGERDRGHRRPTPAQPEFNALSPDALAVAVDTTHTRIALTDLGGAVIAEDEIDVAGRRGPSVVLDRIATAMARAPGQAVGRPRTPVWRRA